MQGRNLIDTIIIIVLKNGSEINESISLKKLEVNQLSQKVLDIECIDVVDETVLKA
jgi:hypothetical protein